MVDKEASPRVSRATIILSALMLQSNNTTLCNTEHSVRFQKLNPQNKFKILQLADLHYEPNEEIIKKNQEITRNLLDFEKPDLVIFSGDQISGWKTKDYKELQQKVVQPLFESNTNWATVLGNHDIESNLSPQQILCEDSLFPTSMTLHTQYVNENQIDYILPIHSQDLSTVVAWILMLDASVMECQGVAGAGCVTTQQIAWINSTFSPIHNNKPTLAFFHQPMPEYNKVYHFYNTYGGRRESSGCSTENPGLYDVLKQLPVWGTSVGHDHNNEFTGRIENDKISLSYGRKTGYGSYGPDYTDRGARVYEFSEDTIRTWIRTEKELILEQKLHKPDPSKFLKCGEDDSWTLVIVLSVLLTAAVVGFIAIGFYLRRKRNIDRLGTRLLG